MRALKDQCEILAWAMVAFIVLYVVWWALLAPALSSLMRAVDAMVGW
jgi:F0F1-type ATP synthase membrane subunit b/b'